jgi:Golgi phosphoprotein 3 (GPP34)
MRNVGEDIVLLAIGRNGTIATYEKLCFALAGSELVQLVDAQRIEFDLYGGITVLDASPTGDALVDLALARLVEGTPPPTAWQWVARQHPELVNRYLARHSEAGTIRFEDRTVLGLLRIQRWTVLDPARVTEARARLDAIVSATGPLTSEQVVFAGLVHAVGLGGSLYPKRAGQAARSRLEAIAAQNDTVKTVAGARDAASNAVGTSAATNTVLQVGIWTAIETSVNATLHTVAHHHQSGQGNGAHPESGVHHGGAVYHSGGVHHDGGFHHGGGGMDGGHHG